ncbi:MAG: hypothetical protein ABTQ34_04740 [Bdellovibrionales bacterium]
MAFLCDKTGKRHKKCRHREEPQATWRSRVVKKVLTILDCRVVPAFGGNLLAMTTQFCILFSAGSRWV